MSPLARTRPFVLVVEDEALVRDCTVAQLQDAGFTVIEAACGEQAMRAFEDHALVTTVFSDINMPGAFDGLSLVNKIFRLRPDVQLILTSGRGLPLDAMMPAGARFLLKPYKANQLTALIRAA
jgi:two-component system, response regulator PdtaR